MKKSTHTLITGLVLGAALGVGGSFYAGYELYARGTIAFVAVNEFETPTRDFALEDSADCVVTRYNTGRDGQTVIVNGRSPRGTYSGGFIFNNVQVDRNTYIAEKASWGMVVSPPGGMVDDENRTVSNACREGTLARGLDFGTWINLKKK